MALNQLKEKERKKDKTKENMESESLNESESKSNILSIIWMTPDSLRISSKKEKELCEDIETWA